MILQLFKGIYPYFTAFAAIGIFLRIRHKEWTSAETVILAIFIMHCALTVFQVGCFGTEWNFSRRYLLPAAPLLFGWSGYAIGKLLKYKLVRCLLPLMVIFLIADAMRPSLEHHWKKSKKHQYNVVTTFVPIIRNDWKGNSRYTPELWWDEYRSPKQPIIQCDFPALGYFSGGRFWNTESTEKIRPDYILQVGFHVPETEYDRVYSVKIDSVNYVLWKKANK